MRVLARRQCFGAKAGKNCALCINFAGFEDSKDRICGQYEGWIHCRYRFAGMWAVIAALLENFEVTIWVLKQEAERRAGR
jgi:hypothetical protein